MTWIKLSDGFDNNDKMLRLTHPAFRLFVCSQTFCGRQMKELRGKANEVGTLSSRQAIGLAKQQGVKSSVIRELVQHGLWLESEHGFRIYKFEKYLPTRREQQADRGEPDPVKQSAGSKGAAARWQTGSRPVAQVVAPLKQTGSPVPVPVPVNVKGTTTVKTREAEQASSDQPPDGYTQDTSDPEVWLSPDGSDAWTTPPQPPGALDEVRLRKTAAAMQELVHASFGRFRRLLTEHPGYTVADLKAALKYPATVAEDPKDALAFVTTAYAEGGLTIIERCYRERVTAENERRHQTVRQDEQKGVQSVGDILAEAQRREPSQPTSDVLPDMLGTP